MRGIRVDNKIKQWALVLLARTSKRVYMEVAKVLKLPNVSYIYRLSNQIVSRNHSRGYLLCFQTIHTMKKKIKVKWTKKSIVMKSNEFYMCLESSQSFVETNAW